MKVHLIGYASGRFLARKPDFIKEVKRFKKIDHFRIYGYEDLDSTFKERHADILREARFGGYAIWKPYIIYHHLNTMDEGDILFYVDVGCRVNANNEAYAVFDQYLQLIQEHNVMALELRYYEQRWTNTVTLDYFKHHFNLKAAQIFNSYQLITTVMGYKKCKEAQRFAKAYLDIVADDAYLFTDAYNNIGKIKEHREHRHDQSVFSLLFKSLKIGVIRSGDAYGLRKARLAQHLPFNGNRINYGNNITTRLYRIRINIGNYIKSILRSILLSILSEKTILMIKYYTRGR